jgi:hypothetical protein
MLGSLSPVVHPKHWHLVRVPVMRAVDEHYTVFVGDRTVRRYNDDTLPDALKSKLAMILAHDGGFKDDHVLDNITLYTNNQSPELDEVGWRASHSYFCLILDRETLDSLKGGTQNA